MNRTLGLGFGLVSLLVLVGVARLDTPEEETAPPQRNTTVEVTKSQPSPVGEVARQASGADGVGPSLSRSEQFDKLVELAKTGPGTPDLPEGLRKLGGKKGIDPILSLMRSTNDYKVVGACAIALQNYHDPKLLHDVFMRLDELGYLDKPAKLPWISKTLFAKYMLESPDVTLGMRAVQSRPALGDAIAQAK